MKSPMEVSAFNARKEFCEKNNVDPEDVGVFFISPCAAKITAVKSPLEVNSSSVNGVFSIKMLYPKILRLLSKACTDDVILQAGNEGVGWAVSGGEAVALDTENIIAVDGIQNVVRIFEEPHTLSNMFNRDSFAFRIGLFNGYNCSMASTI